MSTTRPNLPSSRENSVGSREIVSSQVVSRQIYQTIANRIDDQLGSLMNAQSVHHVGAMDGDRVGAKVESGGDLFVRLPFHDHLQHFEFARSKPGVALALERNWTLQLGIEHRFAPCDPSDGLAQLQVHRVFQNVSARPRFK